MSGIKVDVSAVLTAGDQVEKAQILLDEAIEELKSVKRQTESCVLDRDGNRRALEQLIADAEKAKSRLSEIRITAEQGANSYRTADLKLREQQEAVLTGTLASVPGGNAGAFRD